MGTIHLIRHGQASFGSEDYDQLTTLGFRQARRTGKYFAAIGGVDGLIRGDMRRHRETAATLVRSMDVDEPWDIEANPIFNEFDHVEVILAHKPAWADRRQLMEELQRSENSPAQEFQRHFNAAMQRWSSEKHPEYTETWSEFQERCVDGLRQFVDSLGKGLSIGIITSGGVISAIVAHLLSLDDNMRLSINEQITNCSTTTLLYSEDRITLQSFNGDSYLRAPSPSLITYR